ncbi:MAG: signal peptidase I [Zhongshania aliphaticivorans]|jgi:signal peptidase I
MRRSRKQAKEMLQMASKVYHYRRDVIPEAQLAQLEEAVNEVESMHADKAAEPEPLQAAMERLDTLLRKIGGKIYPKTFWSDNLEVLLVAAILVIGVRTFFFQPFIIPTNSMYPTYNGMTYKVYAEEDASAGGLLPRIFNKVRLGAKHKSLKAENDGKLLIPIAGRNQKGDLVFFREQVPGRKWLFLPTVLNEYIFYVDGHAHALRVPGEFDASALLLEAFNSDESRIVPSAKSPSGVALDTGHYFETGDPILHFDINLGDALFVDRISYHFKRPKVGDAFVFRTREISKELGDKYYIKRLAGTGGETLEIRDGVLFANDEPRDEAQAFILNAEKEGEYDGYVDLGLLAEGRKLIIPENSFVALGDNSDNSRDSRSWGFVPDKTVIGKAIFIYYPFTERWGLAE